MGTEILRPQDCLIERIRVSPCRRRNYYGTGNGNLCTSNPSYTNPNPKSNRKPAVRSERSAADLRKRQPEPLASRRANSVGDLRTSKNQNLLMEKVTILRRGESLDTKVRSSEAAPLKKVHSGGGLVVTGTDRLGPDPKMVQKQVKIVDLRAPVAAGKCDVYAGSAFAMSPAPSALPLPSFSKKKEASVDDSATRDLRRLLRLDF